jgi:hypothetical protein
VATVGNVPDTARNAMPIGSCHGSLPFAKLEKISAEKEYSPDFAPKNRPIGGFWRGNYGEIYVISIIYLGPTPNLRLEYFSWFMLLYPNVANNQCKWSAEEIASELICLVMPARYLPNRTLKN